mmetsp:Transcript_20713/g.28160  ORF Transcript_20713/g.28160 Transcript_20713/m.28160 type:complete len:229 (-) Transcript_20713:13-699(-)
MDLFYFTGGFSFRTKAIRMWTVSSTGTRAPRSLPASRETLSQWSSTGVPFRLTSMVTSDTTLGLPSLTRNNSLLSTCVTPAVPSPTLMGPMVFVGISSAVSPFLTGGCSGTRRHSFSTSNRMASNWSALRRVMLTGISTWAFKLISSLSSGEVLSVVRGLMMVGADINSWPSMGQMSLTRMVHWAVYFVAFSTDKGPPNPTPPFMSPKGDGLGGGGEAIDFNLPTFDP